MFVEVSFIFSTYLFVNIIRHAVFKRIHFYLLLPASNNNNNNKKKKNKYNFLVCIDTEFRYSRTMQIFKIIYSCCTFAYTYVCVCACVCVRVSMCVNRKRGTETAWVSLGLLLRWWGTCICMYL